MADTHDTLCAELDSMKVVYITRVRGGTRSDRERKVKEIRGDRFYCFAIEHGVSESAVWRFEDPGGPVKLPWEKICRLTALGNSLCPDRACIIDLDRFEPRFTTYEVNPEKLTINVLPAAAVADPITAGKRDGSLRWILESHARPLCVVNWPKGGDVDANNLPHLPATVKQLDLRGMSNFLRGRVPTKYECGPDHWIHNFVAKFKKLKTLTLTDCQYRLEDVAILEPRMILISCIIESKME
ncbi:hypothetical protein QBC42DRAFT_282196 [Cladorrhinum samala]|uniref:Uncharacterized protein n=1 Tax=Cladorrhinum samala TaxID=585594 RepID=A0AAV9I4L6_9PEZI|nr:hypothetical protein QBC42DRAFT_282196 [Cladorrhinum samala]